YAMRQTYGGALFSTYGFRDAFNPTFTQASAAGWVDVDYLGIDQGPIIAMIENYRTGLVWRVMRGNPYIVQGLCRAGFTGGRRTRSSCRHTSGTRRRTWRSSATPGSLSSWR